jgi:hypothetical protein
LNQIRQTFNSQSVSNSSPTVTKVRPGNVRRGHSQSQADIHVSSKFSSLNQEQNQRTSLNGLVDMANSPTPSILTPSSNGHTTPTLSKTEPSSTTALMMINKQYANNSLPCLPPTTNHHRHNTKTISFYQKRQSNHT